MIFVSERIKERRNALNMSADDLAEKIGVNRSTIFRYENGGIDKVPALVLDKISKALHCSPHYLLGWTDECVAAEIVLSEEEEEGRNARLTAYISKFDPKLLDRMLAAGGKLPKEKLESFVDAIEYAVSSCESARKEKPQD